MVSNNSTPRSTNGLIIAIAVMGKHHLSVWAKNLPSSRIATFARQEAAVKANGWRNLHTPVRSIQQSLLWQTRLAIQRKQARESPRLQPPNLQPNNPTGPIAAARSASENGRELSLSKSEAERGARRRADGPATVGTSDGRYLHCIGDDKRRNCGPEKATDRCKRDFENARQQTPTRPRQRC